MLLKQFYSLESLSLCLFLSSASTSPISNLHILGVDVDEPTASSSIGKPNYTLSRPRDRINRKCYTLTQEWPIKYICNLANCICDSNGEVDCSFLEDAELDYMNSYTLLNNEFVQLCKDSSCYCEHSASCSASCSAGTSALPCVEGDDTPCCDGFICVVQEMKDAPMMYGSTLFRGFGTCTSLLVIAHNWQNAFAEGSSKNRPLFWRLNLPPGLPKNLPFCGDFLRQQNQIHNIKSRHFDGHIEEGEVDEIIREGDKSELAKRDGAMAASAIDRRVVALERLRKAISGRADTMHGADSSPLVQRSEKPPPPSLTCPNAPHGIRFDAGHFKNLSPVQVCSIAGCHCLLSGRVSCTRPKSRYWSWQDEVNEQMAPLCMKEYCYCVDATTGVKLDPPAQNGPNDDDPQMCIPGQEGDESCGEGGDCVAQSPKDAWTLWGVDPVIGIAVGACTYAMLRTFGGLIPGAINGVAAVIAHIVPDPDVAANAGAGQIVAGRGLLGEKLSGHEWGEGFPKVPEVLRGVA